MENELLEISKILEYLSLKGLKYEYTGPQDLSISGYSALRSYQPGTITWARKQEIADTYKQRLKLCVTTQSISVDAEGVIVSDNPKECFFEILWGFYVPDEGPPRIEQDSVVETDHIGKNVRIGHHCYISKDTYIADNVTIMHNVSIIGKVHIGENTVIACGVVIGTPGYGYYENDKGINKRVPHLGGVTIGKNVEIGANTCIDRGTMDDTVIGDEVKICDLCHIAHNVKIEFNSMLAAMTMLAGSSHLEKNSYAAPGSLILDQCTIHQRGFVGMGSVVIRDVKENEFVFGNPARPVLAPGMSIINDQ